MSWQSSVGNANMHSANEQRDKDESGAGQHHKGDRYDEGTQGSHKPLDSSKSTIYTSRLRWQHAPQQRSLELIDMSPEDQRSIANKLANEEKVRSTQGPSFQSPL